MLGDRGSQCQGNVTFCFLINPVYTKTLPEMSGLELGQYTNISIYRNTDNHNIISIHPITVSIYRNIVIYRNILTYLEGINVKAHLKSTTCLFAISNDV